VEGNLKRKQAEWKATSMEQIHHHTAYLQLINLFTIQKFKLSAGSMLPLPSQTELGTAQTKLVFHILLTILQILSGPWETLN
jgi:hypothetical protein